MSILFDEFDIFELFLSEPDYVSCKNGKSGMVFRKLNGEERLELTIFPNCNFVYVRMFLSESKIIDVSLIDVTRIEKREMYAIFYRGENIVASIFLSDKIKMSFDNQDMW